MFCKRHVTNCMLTLLVLSGGVRVSPAQDLPAEPDKVLADLDVRISSFLEGVSLGQAQSAYEELLAGSLLLKQKEALKELTSKTDELKKYGKYRAFERIAARRIGSDLVLMKYLYKCEDFPVVWYFSLYRVPDAGETTAEDGAWRVVTVRFDTELELLGF